MLLFKHYKLFVKDLKEHAKVNYYACELPNIEPAKPKSIEEAMENLQKIRDLAKKHYDSELVEKS
jgi:hypothetical protein